MAEDHSFEDIMQRIQQQEAEQQAQAKLALRALCDRLASLKVTTVNISYDGYGDSGTIDTITALKGEEVVTLDRELREALHQETCDLLPTGWEINDGSFGEMVIDVNSRCVVRQHSWRATEYDEGSLSCESLSPCPFECRQVWRRGRRLPPATCLV